MKKNKLYIAVIAFLALTSCSKTFLNTEDVTTASDQNFYKTPSDAYKALVGVYAGLKIANTDGFPAYSEVLSDNAFGGTGYGDGKGWQAMDEFDPTVSPADQNLFSSVWSDYYTAIYRANMLLKNIGQVNWSGSVDNTKMYTAETKFIRAYCYFDMVRFFGNIPCSQHLQTIMFHKPIPTVFIVL